MVNNLLKYVKQSIKDGKKLALKSPKIDKIQKSIVGVPEGFFYSNVIINYRNNLTQNNLKEFNITKEELKLIKNKFKELFKRCDECLKSDSNKIKIDSKIYQAFKKKLNEISKNSYNLLLELEKYIKFNSCEEYINQFKREIKTFGKELKIQKGDDGISIGFEGCNNYNNNFSEKITNFNDFVINLEVECLNINGKKYVRWITLEDKNGNFRGNYNQSRNKSYIIAYTDAYEKEDKNGRRIIVSGQVYLIKDKKKILWRKDIARPNDAFVTDDGTVIIIDWISFSPNELSGKIYFFNDKGEKLFEYKFNYNIGGQAISNDEKEIIITTCNPENYIYLFDIKNRRLINKIKNTISKKPLIDFKFEDIKNLF